MARDFGLWREYPDDADAAWGTRAILERGRLDLLSDRMGFDEIKEEWATRRLASLLDNGDLLSRIKKRVADMLANGEIRPEKAELREVSEATTGVPGYSDYVKPVRVLANTNGSCGYLYVVVFVPKGEWLDPHPGRRHLKVHSLPREGEPSKEGTTTGGAMRCRLEGCRGTRIYTRWSGGMITAPCSEGMVFHEGDWWIQ
jgi:hypothetical protein